jgi:hypothetical protein
MNLCLRLKLLFILTNIRERSKNPIEKFLLRFLFAQKSNQKRAPQKPTLKLLFYPQKFLRHAATKLRVRTFSGGLRAGLKLHSDKSFMEST